VPLEEAVARLVIATTNTLHIDVLTTGQHEFALSCPAGPAVFSRGDGQLTYFLAGEISNNYVGSWSPDGERLLVYLNGQTALVDFAAGTSAWIPSVTQQFYSYPLTWMTDTVFATGVWPRTANGQDGRGKFSLSFMDMSDPGRQFPIYSNILSYVLSPDGSTAAVVRQQGEEPAREVALMPALGGPMTPVDAGIAPAWSPDGRSLAYVHPLEAEALGPLSLVEGELEYLVIPDLGASLFSVRVRDLDTGVIRDILSSQDIGFAHPPSFVQLFWSPDGTSIAFNVTADGPGEIAAGLVRSDGSNLEVLLNRTAGGAQIQFSADGKYLAVSFYDVWPQRTLLYDVATGAQLGWPQISGAYEWSPSGHQLVMLSDHGLHLLADPGDWKSRLQTLLATEGCYNVKWNPAAP
jgi:hypothetical protein